MIEALSLNISVGHQHPKDIIKIKSPTSTCHQHPLVTNIYVAQTTDQIQPAYLYMVHQETLFEPMKMIQMDSDHQLNINVCDN